MTSRRPLLVSLLLASCTAEVAPPPCEPYAWDECSQPPVEDQTHLVPETPNTWRCLGDTYGLPAGCNQLNVGDQIWCCP